MDVTGQDIFRIGSGAETGGHTFAVGYSVVPEAADGTRKLERQIVSLLTMVYTDIHAIRQRLETRWYRRLWSWVKEVLHVA